MYRIKNVNNIKTNFNEGIFLNRFFSIFDVSSSSKLKWNSKYFYTNSAFTPPTTTPPTSIHPKHSAPLSPAVLHLLTLSGISDATKITATGPKGRLLKGDVLTYLGKIAPRIKTAKEQERDVEKDRTKPSPTVAAPIKSTRESSKYKDLDISSRKKVEASRLIESKSAIPHSYISKTINIDEFLKFRQTINEQLKTNITMNDFFVKAASIALHKSPEFNVHYDPTSESLTSKNTDIDISVAAPSEITQTVIRKTEEKGLKTISQLIKESSSKAKESKLLPEEYKGMLGVDEFTGIINPPQSSILAIGSVRPVTEIPDVTDNTNDSDVLDYLGSKPDSILSSSSSLDDDALDIIEYLGGIIPLPKNKSRSPSIESQEMIQKRLSPRVDTSYIISVQLSIDERVVNPVVAAEFLDRFAKVVEAPERILL
ncbi:1792_t:CDS:2 [Ambispora gerdemannii]|uniref:1792_t:CDS:1 n=1 Tax=Ambispora gerdemannii TaxID=144530 RepID=A0A9N8YMK9_9GLOM|nr:1792_t:CDS:2 [Ambispora gerdemannii]